MKNFFHSWIVALTGGDQTTAATQRQCFHCAQPIAQLIEMEFAGSQRALCCHGCQAVLQAIQDAGASAEYLRNKAATQAQADAMRRQ